MKCPAWNLSMSTLVFRMTVAWLYNPYETKFYFVVSHKNLKYKAYVLFVLWNSSYGARASEACIMNLELTEAHELISGAVEWTSYALHLACWTQAKGKLCTALNKLFIPK